MMKNIIPLGKVEKCPRVSVLTKGDNPEFNKFALLPLPLDVDEIFIKFQDHWFPSRNQALCYDMSGMPVLAITKLDTEDQEFGYTRMIKDENKDSPPEQDKC